MLRVLLAVLAGLGVVKTLPKQDAGPESGNLETLLSAGSDYAAMYRSLETVHKPVDPPDLSKLKLTEISESEGRIEAPLGDVLVVGASFGEWGGRIEVFKGEERVFASKAWWRNPRAAVKVGERLFVLEGLRHLGGSTGQITEVAKTPSGWTAEVLAVLPDAPSAWAIDENDELIIVTHAGRAVRFTKDNQLRQF